MAAATLPSRAKRVRIPRASLRVAMSSPFGGSRRRARRNAGRVIPEGRSSSKRASSLPSSLTLTVARGPSPTRPPYLPRLMATTGGIRYRLAQGGGPRRDIQHNASKGCHSSTGGVKSHPSRRTSGSRNYP